MTGGEISGVDVLQAQDPLFAQIGAAFIEAYGEDIEALRKDEKTNVSVILRAIQTGVDIVPELQKQLHLQWATLKAKSASNS